MALLIPAFLKWVRIAGGEPDIDPDPNIGGVAMAPAWSDAWLPALQRLADEVLLVTPAPQPDPDDPDAMPQYEGVVIEEPNRMWYAAHGALMARLFVGPVLVDYVRAKRVLNALAFESLALPLEKAYDLPQRFVPFVAANENAAGQYAENRLRCGSLADDTSLQHRRRVGGKSAARAVANSGMEATQGRWLLVIERRSVTVGSYLSASLQRSDAVTTLFRSLLETLRCAELLGVRLNLLRCASLRVRRAAPGEGADATLPHETEYMDLSSFSAPGPGLNRALYELTSLGVGSAVDYSAPVLGAAADPQMLLTGHASTASSDAWQVLCIGAQMMLHGHEIKPGMAYDCDQRAPLLTLWYVHGDGAAASVYGAALRDNVVLQAAIGTWLLTQITGVGTPPTVHASVAEIGRHAIAEDNAAVRITTAIADAMAVLGMTEIFKAALAGAPLSAGALLAAAALPVSSHTTSEPEALLATPQQQPSRTPKAVVLPQRPPSAAQATALRTLDDMLGVVLAGVKREYEPDWFAQNLPRLAQATLPGKPRTQLVAVLLAAMASIDEARADPSVIAPFYDFLGNEPWKSAAEEASNEPLLIAEDAWRASWTPEQQRAVMAYERAALRRFASGIVDPRFNKAALGDLYTLNALARLRTWIKDMITDTVLRKGVPLLVVLLGQQAQKYASETPIATTSPAGKSIVLWMSTETDALLEGAVTDETRRRWRLLLSQ